MIKTLWSRWKATSPCREKSCDGTCRPIVERLETRQLLSADPAWSDAPFDIAVDQGILYTNQHGDARLLGTLPSDAPHAYGVRLGAAGVVAADVKGPLNAHLAYYAGDGQPAAEGTPTATGQALRATLPAKGLTWFAVQRGEEATTGGYELFVNGPRPRVIQSLFVSAATGIGAAMGALGTAYETDFYEFTTTQAGEWTLTVRGVKTLDLSLNVFDAAGNPVGGTYTSAINATGPGGAETWVGRGLAAGMRYFVRVDSPNNSRGSYTIDVKRTLLPTDKKPVLPALTVTAVQRKIDESSTGSATFQISRPKGSDLSSPLLVYYRMSGTAKAGVDYKAVKGYIAIPAKRLHATVKIAPIADDIFEGDEQVVLSLRPLTSYGMGKPTNATITIVDRPPQVKGWPEAPFDRAVMRGTIYVNQFGRATITGSIREGELHGYELFYDDPGTLEVEIKGTAQTTMAYYGNYGGLPTKLADGHFSVPVPADKRSLFICIRGKRAGSYTLKLDGPPMWLEHTPLKNNAGSNGSTLSSNNDSDFFAFTTTQAGIWVVEAIPDKAKKPLDVEMILFDDVGNPVAGTYLKPINAGGRGFHERWQGKLKGNTKYYLRIDGVGDWVTEEYGFGVGMFLLA